jgi:hypothetical protein
MGFQTACAMLQLVRMPEDFPSAVSFCLEGQDEAIDFEVRGKDDRARWLEFH